MTFGKESKNFRKRFVAIRHWMVSFGCLAAISILAACGGNNNLTLQNPPAPAATSPSIAFNPAPTGSISLAGTTSLTAVVNNDPSNAGVDWALLCPAGSTCGTLSPLHTASGKPTSYKPPPTISGNSQSVTVEAFAAADHNSNVVASFTVTGFDADLKGSYVFATQGQDANGAYQLAGVMVLDGNGNITGGEQTHNDPLISVTDKITGGTYYIGQDGRGTLTINTADQTIGQLGIENLALVFLSSSKAFIETLDNPVLSQSSVESSYGTLELQTSTVAPIAGYAFVMNGVDINQGPLSLGGIMNIDSPNAISGNGSVADEDDADNITAATTLTGTLTKPDSFGSLKFNLQVAGTNSMQFTGYIVDASHIKLIESDNAGSGIGFGTTAGVAIAQGASTGKFTASSFAGNYTFDILGADPFFVPLSLASYGQFSADANGNLSNGYNDEILSAANLAISDSFSGTYTLDATDTPGTGRVDALNNFSVNGPGPEWILYLTGNGNPPLILDEDDQSGPAAGSLGTGFAHSQSAPPYSFSGDYGVKFAQNNGNTATGEVTANGPAGTASGIIDTNFQFGPQPDLPFSANFGAIPNTGRFTGTLNDSILATPTIAVAFYPVSTSQILFIETDLLTTGFSTFGTFETRTPVCPTCQ